MDNAAKIKTDDNIEISDEMIAEIIAREEYIENNPDCWITAEQSIKQLRERRNANV